VTSKRMVSAAIVAVLVLLGGSLLVSFAPSAWAQMSTNNLCNGEVGCTSGTSTTNNLCNGEVGCTSGTSTTNNLCNGEVGCTSGTSTTNNLCNGEVGCTSGTSSGGMAPGLGARNGAAPGVHTVALARTSATRGSKGGLSAGDALDIVLLGAAALAGGSWLLVRSRHGGTSSGIS